MAIHGSVTATALITQISPVAAPEISRPWNCRRAAAAAPCWTERSRSPRNHGCRHDHSHRHRQQAHRADHRMHLVASDDFDYRGFVGTGRTGLPRVGAAFSAFQDNGIADPASLQAAFGHSREKHKAIGTSAGPTYRQLQRRPSRDSGRTFQARLLSLQYGQGPSGDSKLPRKTRGGRAYTWP